MFQLFSTFITIHSFFFRILFDKFVLRVYIMTVCDANVAQSVEQFTRNE